MKKYLDELLIHLGAEPGQDDIIFSSLMARYAESHRHYHTSSHLAHLFTLLEEQAGQVQDRAALIAAIFFHDVVYDPSSVENEEDSARLAVFTLASWGASQEFCTRVADLIRMTATHRAPAGDSDACLFLDMDMAILGSGGPEYDLYADQVRREYEPIYGAAYNSGRLHKFILPCLAADRLFLTGIMQDKYEAQARLNLQREKAALEARLSQKPSGPAP